MYEEVLDHIENENSGEQRTNPFNLPLKENEPELPERLEIHHPVRFMCLLLKVYHN